MGRKKKETTTTAEAGNVVATMASTPQTLADVTKDVQLKDKEGNLLMPKSDAAIVIHNLTTVKEAINGISILPFAGVYNQGDASEIDDGDIYFDNDAGKFGMKGSGTFTNEDEYNEDNHGRYGVLFRCTKDNGGSTRFYQRYGLYRMTSDTHGYVSGGGGSNHHIVKLTDGSDWYDSDGNYYPTLINKAQSQAETATSLANTNAEAIEAIGIYKFQGISYDGSTTGFVNNSDIIFDMTQHKFIIKSGTFTNEANYNSNGVARSDVLFRCVPASDMVSFNGTYGLYHYVGGNNNPFPRLVDESDMATEISPLQEQLAETPNINIIPYPFPNGKQGNNFVHSDTGSGITFDGLLQNYYMTFQPSGNSSLSFNDVTTITVSTTGYFTFSCMARAVEGYDQPATINFMRFDEGTINMLDGVTLSTTTWTKLSVTGTFSSDTISSGVYWINFRSSSTSQRVQLGNFKLETGSTATAWQPSLRDLGLF